MSKSIMIQGTASNSGKSLIAAGLCRIFSEDGFRVAPFKSQNMALNSFVTKDGLEMGRAQVMQAEAAGVVPDVRMNPVLLKPTGERKSQVVVNGEVLGTMDAVDYFRFKKQLVPDIMKSFESLAAENDIIVLEGAGSPAEINLKTDDIVNMGLAEMTKSPVLLVGDIDRGGVFAALAGTVQLVTERERELIKGLVINKFRGDKDILSPGLLMLSDIVKKPVLGVVPFLDIKVDDEDSLTDRFTHIKNSAENILDIAVIRLPRISNFTDFNPLEYIEGVGVRYVSNVRDLENPDLIILPGTKNTMADLKWLRETGLESAVKKFADKNKPIMGICGGYQMLGQRLHDPLGMEEGGELLGIGLLPHDTVFEPNKTRHQKTDRLSDVDGIFKKLSGLSYTGYEIHMGISHTQKNIANVGNVYGTYIHGIFDREKISKTIIEALLAEKGKSFSEIKSFDIEEFKQTQYIKLAKGLREALDMEKIYKILEEGI